MATKTNGKELKEFWNLGEPWWLKDGWVEGDSYTVNGVEMDDTFEPGSCADTDQITIVSGVIVDAVSERELDLNSQFRKWRKSLTTTTVLVEIDLDKLDDLKTHVKSLKGKIV
uniref:Uncharacterized protein n=1 Tax=Pseudomonas phage Nican01 TaxID=3138540 RepID=A0AAU6W0A8_9CAUD